MVTSKTLSEVWLHSGMQNAGSRIHCVYSVCVKSRFHSHDVLGVKNVTDVK